MTEAVHQINAIAADPFGKFHLYRRGTDAVLVHKPHFVAGFQRGGESRNRLARGSIDPDFVFRKAFQ